MASPTRHPFSYSSPPSSPSTTRTAIDNYVVPLVSRARTRKGLFVLVTFGAVLLFLNSNLLGPASSRWTFGGVSVPLEEGCSPRGYAEGRWVYRPYYERAGPLSSGSSRRQQQGQGQGALRPKNMTKPEDVLDFARFGGCASSREFWWHFAADREEQWDRFPRALEWEWVPGGRCVQDGGGGLREWQVEEVIRDLVEGGGWLLVGDSVTENHFFSLSCLLYPHVIATPDYTKSSSFDRAWPQHLYLNPDSPLLQHDASNLITKHKAGLQPPPRKGLRLPPGFDVSKTPLVTFRRIDLLWSQEELEHMHRKLHPEFYRGEFKLFGDETVWSISPDEYLDLFMKKAPEARYTTMVVSTAGHWTTNLFAGYHNEPEDKTNNNDNNDSAALPVYGYDGLLQFFEEVMQRWAEKVQKRIDREAAVRSGSGSGSTYPPSRDVDVPRERTQRVVVRAYLPGHEDCHNHRSPWEEIVPFQWNWWNWGVIGRYNEVFETILSGSNKGVAVPLKNVHYLPIDRPGRLRPDAHASGDCLHIMTGAGVLEGWTHYIWHYITREEV